MKVIEADNIVKHFTDGREVIHVLRGVSLSLDAGEILTLEGPSGSGKTTLISILGCMLSASSGVVTINGNSVDFDDSSQLARIRRQFIGFVFQQFNLFPALTALENVEYSLNIRGSKGREARSKAERMLDCVGLTERKHSVPGDLSGGQKQRVAIARALVGGMPLIFADEPTASLDSASGRQILLLLRELAKRERRALLIVTHDPKVREITDRTVTIRDGMLFDRGLL